ncbi:hypothetical protein BGY98DRAFT_963441 [Russula aff. rugulosa BPL654]|nr:hypothetical protein BGY98DRAFT_963441 [Russula aff. rugulosa BPL654]
MRWMLANVNMQQCDTCHEWIQRLANFYVNIFVDRDMLMRHFGHGVGHLKYERQHGIETEITRVESDDDDDDDDSESDIVTHAQEDNVAVDVEEESQGESDREMDADGYDSEDEMIGDIVT